MVSSGAVPVRRTGDTPVCPSGRNAGASATRCSRAVMHDLAVDAGDDAQAVPRITNFIRGDDLAHRTALVGILADGPLSGAVLGLAGSEVVERGVTEDSLESFHRRDVFQSLADDCYEFALPIQALLAGRDRRRRA